MNDFRAKVVQEYLDLLPKKAAEKNPKKAAMAEILKKHGIDRATVYRWLRRAKKVVANCDDISVA